MKTNKVMKLIDPGTGKMVCTICGAVQWAKINNEGKFNADSWHCQKQCKIEFTDSFQLDILSLFIEDPEERKELSLTMPTLPCLYNETPNMYRDV